MLWLETGFDVCREGCVSFSHPANQNHAGGSNPKPLGSWLKADLGEQGPGWVSG